MIKPKIFIALLAVFVIFLVGSIVSRSMDRDSVLSPFGLLAGQQDDPGVEEPSRLQLHDFHRVEMKDGKLAWEVRAKEAKYFAKAGVSHVNDALLTLHQDDGTTVIIDATVAKLFIGDDGLTSAELEGSVEVTGSEGVKITTSRALYTAADGSIRSSEPVRIIGPNYSINGRGFTFNLQSSDFILEREVRSEFLTS